MLACDACVDVRRVGGEGNIGGSVVCLLRAAASLTVAVLSYARQFLGFFGVVVFKGKQILLFLKECEVSPGMGRTS